MATEVVDLSSLASLEAPAAPAAAVEANVEKPAVDVASDLPKTAPVDKPESKTDSEVKTDEAKPGEAKVENAVRVELAKKAPQVLAKSVHEALSAFMSEHPSKEGVEKLRAINDSVAVLYEQVAEAKALGKDVQEVTDSAQALSDAVAKTDGLLYSSEDPAKASELVENIYADVTDNAPPEAYDGFVAAAIEKLKAERPEAYLKHVAGVYHDSLQSTGAVDAVRDLIKAFNSGDNAGLRKTIEALKNHVEEIGGITEKHRVAKETAATTKQAEAYRIEQTDVCHKEMNTSLSKPFRVVLNNTELGTMPRDAQLAVAREVRDEAMRLMAADQFYVKLLNSAFEKRNTAEIKRLYSVKINSVAQAATDKAVKTLYPRGLGERKATAKASAVKKISTPLGDAVYVSEKPSDLDREAKGARTAEIAGYGYRKGSKQLITWRQSH